MKIFYLLPVYKFNEILSSITGEKFSVVECYNDSIQAGACLKNGAELQKMKQHLLQSSQN